MGYLRKAIYSYPQDIQNCKKERSFEEIYLNILNEEVAKDYFTPEPLLNDIVDKCFWNYSNIGMFESYPLEKIIRISDQVLKNKQKFNYALNNVKTNRDFAINIIYLKQISISAINQLSKSIPPEFFQQSVNSEYTDQLFNIIKFALSTIKHNIDSFKLSKGNNFNNIEASPRSGCCIFINGELVKTHNQIEALVDHQLNHYFTKMGFFEGYKNVNYNIPSINETPKLSVLLNKYYHFNNDKNYEFNIKLHLYNDREFYSMCATVFHTLLNQITKFNNKLTEESFLNMINYNFINQSDFLNNKILNHDLREAVIFCYVNKELSSDRFEIIKRGIHTAFGIKKNIFQKFYIKTRDLIRNLICEENK